MQTFNQSNQSNVMPLLMNFTTPSPIQEIKESQYSYNNEAQISYEMRTVGTYYLKSSSTRKKTLSGGSAPYSDRKNAVV